MTSPPIGVPRCYDGPGIPILYPGEVASALFEPGAVNRALAFGTPVQPIGWMIEPAPGWFARYLRWRYRCFGRWFSRGAPKFETRVELVDHRKES